MVETATIGGYAAWVRARRTPPRASPSSGTWTTSATGSWPASGRPTRTTAARRTCRCGRSSPVATGSSPPRPARGPTGRSSCATCSASRTCISLGTPGPTHDQRSWTFDLDPGGVDPVLGIDAPAGGLLQPGARLPQGHHGAGDRRRRDASQVVTNDFPQITHDLFFEWREHHRPDAPDLWPADLREEMEAVMKRVFTEVNNGVYRCGFAGSQEAYDDGVRPPLGRHGLARGAPDRPPLPDGRRDHRGRRPALHDAGPLRRGLPRALQVQPRQAHRDAGAVGLRARPLPDAGLRRDDRLRADQAALLRRAHRREPDRHRAAGARTPGAG